MLLRYCMPSRALPDVRSGTLLGDDDNELAIHLSLCDTTSLRMPVSLRRRGLDNVKTLYCPQIFRLVVVYSRWVVYIPTANLASHQGYYIAVRRYT